MSQDQAKTSPSASPAPVRTVLLIGHCGFDESSLARVVTTALPGVSVSSAHHPDMLDQHATAEALWLVNRVLDGRFDSSNGVDLIARFARKDQPPRLMLISDYPDAQAQAVAAGARPGIGKRGLRLPDTQTKLREAAGL